MEKTLFEQMGGTYTRVGEYYIHCLALSAEKENKPINFGGSVTNAIYRKTKRRFTPFCS